MKGSDAQAWGSWYISGLCFVCAVCILTSMRVNIWIKKEDEALWLALPDKPKFIHGALQLTTNQYWEQLMANWAAQQATEGQGK